MSIRRGINKKKENNISYSNFHALSGKKPKKTAIKNKQGSKQDYGGGFEQADLQRDVEKMYIKEAPINTKELNEKILTSNDMHLMLDSKIKQNLQEGATIFSKNADHKYLLHHYNFNNKREYEQFTDSLIYRLKIIGSCKKIQPFINPIQGIFVQKIVSNPCSTCNSCLLYKMYIVQQFHPLNLQNFLKEEDASYYDIKNIVHSYCMTMSVYQSKRLRVDNVDFSQIFITKMNKQSKMQRTVQTLAVSLAREQQLPLNFKKQQVKLSNDPQNLLDTYYCKFSDPLIKKYKRSVNQQNEQQTNNEQDVYKSQVYKFAKTLNGYLKLKQNQIDKVQIESQHKIQNIKNNEQEAKQFLQNLIHKHMLCSSNIRYNWLQIQRHFQNYNNSRTQSRKIDMIPTESKISYQPQYPNYKSSSVDKVLAKDHFKKQLPYYVPGRSHAMNDVHTTVNNSINKQNAGGHNTSFISLKPYHKSNSRPNITTDSQRPQFQQPLTPRSQITIPQIPLTNNKSYLQINNMNIANQIPQTPAFNFPPSQIKYQLSKQQKNSGYGIVENPCPETVPNGKIQYHNLYNIGRAWTKFQGSFVDGSKEGPGTIYLSNGHIFNGFFVKDLANGKGSVYVDGDLVLKGTWKNNMLMTQF